MERIVSGKVLVEPLGMLADCYDGPESVAFFKSYSNRSPCEIAQERFWEKLDDLGLIEKDKPYVLTYKSKFPYVNFIINVDDLFKTCPSILEHFRQYFNDDDWKYVEELFE